jgi:hypothetical protein
VLRMYKPHHVRNIVLTIMRVIIDPRTPAVKVIIDLRTPVVKVVVNPRTPVVKVVVNLRTPVVKAAVKGKAAAQTNTTRLILLLVLKSYGKMHFLHRIFHFTSKPYPKCANDSSRSSTFCHPDPNRVMHAYMKRQVTPAIDITQ